MKMSNDLESKIFLCQTKDTRIALRELSTEAYFFEPTKLKDVRGSIKMLLSKSFYVMITGLSCRVVRKYKCNCLFLE